MSLDLTIKAPPIIVVEPTQSAYDPKSHRYIISVDFASKKFGKYARLLAQDNASFGTYIADLVSRQIYSLYYSKKKSEDFYKAEFYAAQEFNYEFILEAQLNQMEYALTSGGHLVGLQPGLSVKQMQSLDKDLLEKMRVAPQAVDALERNNLLYEDRFTFKLDNADIRVGY